MPCNAVKSKGSRNGAAGATAAMLYFEDGSGRGVVQNETEGGGGEQGDEEDG